MADGNTTLADRYVLEDRIASGGMAAVWRARDDVLARPVAVKVLHEHLAQDSSFVERFRIEALAAARLAHPNIVAIYDTGHDDDQHFIVMEHCAGGTLSDLLKEDGPLAPERVASLGATICDALAYAHRNGVIHRDIKPANVLVSEHGVLKVTDFGIAKAAFSKKDLTTTGTIIGTVTYISPEQANGEEPDARSDIYALGIVLFELASGRPPFDAESDVATALKHVNEEPPSPRSLRAGIPRSLEEIILKALAKDPADRYQSAEEMRSALRSRDSGGSTQVIRRPAPKKRTAAPAAAGAGGGPSKKPSASFMRNEGKRMLPLVLLILGAIVAAVLVGTLLTQDDDETPAAGNNGNGNSSGSSVIKIANADDFDPGGGGEEHAEDVPKAYDGDPQTAWGTENYNAAITQLKDGVGLLFDLGSAQDVGSVEILFDGSGYNFELRAGDDSGSDQNAFDVIEEVSSSDGRVKLDVGASHRYWLVWITGLPGGGGGRGAIAEVRFLGS